MLTTDPIQFLDAAAASPPAAGPATMRAAMLVIDEHFTVCPDTGADNQYLDAASTVDSARALAQQHALADAIRACGVPTICFPSLADAPDGVFPNNAFATVPGALVIGAMRYPVRQREAARADIRHFFADLMGYRIEDLSPTGVVAELTGPLIIDRARMLGFCGMSERVDEAGARAMHAALGLTATLRFDLAPGEYHTNVVMAVLAGRACVAHRPSLGDAAAQAIERLYAGATLWVSDAEKAAFVANSIAVTSTEVLLSQRAFDALRPESLEFFAAHGFRLRPVALDEIEKAGGSLRCMIAEVF